MDKITRADIQFVVGQYPTWTNLEITDAFFKIQEALIFLVNRGILFHQICLREASKQTIAAQWDLMKWADVYQEARILERAPGVDVTIYLVLRAVNWDHNGMAGGIPSNFVVLDYRAQMGEDWTEFAAMAAHEILHCLGARDEYGGGTIEANCIMSDLAARRICENTMREIKKHLGG